VLEDDGIHSLTQPFRSSWKLGLETETTALKDGKMIYKVDRANEIMHVHSSNRLC